MATLATINAALKTQFIGPVRDQIYSNHILLDGCRYRDASKKLDEPQGSRPFKGIKPISEIVQHTGRGWEMPLHTAGNAGIGFRAEMGALPGAGSQGYKSISGTIRYQYLRVNWSGQSIRMSDSNKGAFFRAITEEMRRGVDDLKRALVIDAWTARDANGTSPLATVTSGTANATQTLSQKLYLRPGDTVDVVDPTGVTYRNTAALTVLSVSPTALTVTFSSSVTTTTGDYIVRAAPNSAAAGRNNDVGQSINGLLNIVSSSGALHGLNPATAGEGFWASYQRDESAATISDTILRNATDQIGLQSGMDGGHIGLWTRGIRNDYAATLTSLKRFNDAESVTLRGGFKALMFDDHPMVVDDFCPRGNVLFISPDDLFWAESSDFEWLDKDGAVLSRIPDRDGYEATMFKYVDLGTSRRNAHARLFNVKDDIVR